MAGAVISRFRRGGTYFLCQSKKVGKETASSRFRLVAGTLYKGSGSTQNATLSEVLSLSEKSG